METYINTDDLAVVTMKEPTPEQRDGLGNLISDYSRMSSLQLRDLNGYKFKVYLRENDQFEITGYFIDGRTTVNLYLFRNFFVRVIYLGDEQAACQLFCWHKDTRYSVPNPEYNILDTIIDTVTWQGVFDAFIAATNPQIYKCLRIKHLCFGLHDHALFDGETYPVIDESANEFFDRWVASMTLSVHSKITVEEFRCRLETGYYW